MVGGLWGNIGLWGCGGQQLAHSIRFGSGETACEIFDRLSFFVLQIQIGASVGKQASHSSLYRMSHRKVQIFSVAWVPELIQYSLENFSTASARVISDSCDQRL